MLSKIELYREVLEIEPNSKVFFPLARQLAEQNHQDEAVAVLTRGIAFHPDHLEAKFLLIELLTRQGREEQAQEVFTDVGSMLSRYPSVWLLWSKTAAARSKDPSLAMLFLAHYFQNQTLTWADVMERGLQSLSQAAGQAREADGNDEAGLAPTPHGVASVEPAAAAATAVPAAGTERASQAIFPSDPIDAAVSGAPAATVAAAAPAAAPVQAVSVPEPAPQAVGHTEREPADGPELRGAREVLALADILDAPEEPAERSRPRAAKPREQAVRTKTMAAVLAGQGDTAGALDIYGELLATTPAGPDHEELLGLMAALSPPRDVDAGDPGLELRDDAAAPANPLGQKGPTKLVSFLEALAGRLEARAGS